MCKVHQSIANILKEALMLNSYVMCVFCSSEILSYHSFSTLSVTDLFVYFFSSHLIGSIYMSQTNMYRLAYHLLMWDSVTFHNACASNMTINICHQNISVRVSIMKLCWSKPSKRSPDSWMRWFHRFFGFNKLWWGWLVNLIYNTSFLTFFFH